MIGEKANKLLRYPALSLSRKGNGRRIDCFHKKLHKLNVLLMEFKVKDLNWQLRQVIRIANSRLSSLVAGGAGMGWGMLWKLIKLQMRRGSGVFFFCVWRGIAAGVLLKNLALQYFVKNSGGRRYTICILSGVFDVKLITTPSI